jgi:F-type H+-transporting ATPase subunit epsilon
MSARISLNIVTPESVAFQGEVESLVVPAVEGQLGILPGHAPLLAQLSPGVVKIREGEDVRFLSVSGGFVEVLQGQASLFAETAELGEDVDAERARQAAEKARAALQGAGRNDQTWAEAEAALKRALVRLRASEMSRRRSARAVEKPPA